MSEQLVVKHINSERALAKNSKPVPLQHQFLDINGDPIDLSVGTWVGQARAEQLHVAVQPPNVGTGTCQVDALTATATYLWNAADFETIGRFRIILWIGNGTQRFGSTVYEWDVADAPGADPTV